MFLQATAIGAGKGHRRRPQKIVASYGFSSHYREQICNKHTSKNLASKDFSYTIRLMSNCFTGFYSM